MNANYREVLTEFAPETRFEVTPTPAAPFRATVETAFERLKNKLLLERLHALSDPRWNSQLRGVANEAAALAWVTSYPLLVFPGLFQEKAELAIARSSQEQAEECNRKLLEV